MRDRQVGAEGVPGRRLRFNACVISVLIALCGICVRQAEAGQLDKAGVARYFPDPFYVGDRDAALPIWPLFRHNIPAADDFIGYVFESVDFAPIAGYSGTPPDVLVAITPDGKFLNVRVVSHNEPIFKHGVGDEQLAEFADQYARRKLMLRQMIRVSPTNASGQIPATGPETQWIDGVARATVSVRIINETIIASALKVARAKLGIAGGKEPGAAAKLKADSGATLAPKDVVSNGYLVETQITAADIEKSYGAAFKGDLDASPGTDPKATATQVWSLYMSAAEIGRAVIGKDAYQKLAGEFHEGDHAIVIASAGRYGFRGPDQRRGSVPENLVLTQDGLPILINDASDVSFQDVPEFPKVSNAVVIKILKETGFDPTRPFQLAMRITRKNGELFPRRESKDFPVAFKAPVEYFSAPEIALEGWRLVWYEQRLQIALAAALIVVLGAALTMQKRLTSNTRAFNIFRTAFLVVTLAGLGWWAQGQLSINNILAILNAAKSTGDFGYLLFDPVSLLLWAFVLGSLVVFGRGTFCGWLCPFGAFQEFVGNAARKLRLPQYTVPFAIDRKLRLVKYAVLASIVGSALFYMPAAEWLAEVEPFKTSITLGFSRSWPFVFYALAMLGVSAFVYKGFCLYMCPLGASLALLGRLRVFDWIPRRKECGSPCQLCSVRCRYGAIEPAGKVRYDECFQCMDCVVIFNDEKACVPRVLAAKGRSMPAKPLRSAVAAKEIA